MATVGREEWKLEGRKKDDTPGWVDVDLGLYSENLTNRSRSGGCHGRESEPGRMILALGEGFNECARTDRRRRSLALPAQVRNTQVSIQAGVKGLTQRG